MIWLIERAFRTAVRDLAIPVTDQLGFTVESVSGDGFCAKCDLFELRVLHYMMGGFILVEFRPLVGVSEANSRFVGLHWVLTALAPDVREIDRWPRFLLSGGMVPGEIRAEIRRKFALIARYLPVLLSGDEESWSRVRQTALTMDGLIKETGETYEGYIQRLRVEARASWRRGKFWSVRYRLQRLLDLKERLSAWERLRFWQSRMFTIDIDFWM